MALAATPNALHCHRCRSATTLAICTAALALANLMDRWCRRLRKVVRRMWLSRRQHSMRTITCFSANLTYASKHHVLNATEPRQLMITADNNDRNFNLLLPLVVTAVDCLGLRNSCDFLLYKYTLIRCCEAAGVHNGMVSWRSGASSHAGISGDRWSPLPCCSCSSHGSDRACIHPGTDGVSGRHCLQPSEVGRH